MSDFYNVIGLMRFLSIAIGIIFLAGFTWFAISFSKDLKKAAKEIKEAEDQKNARDERIAKALEKIAEEKSK